MLLKRLAIGLMLILAFVSCRNSGNGNDDRVVATIYNKDLHQSDLQSVMYEGISANDSIVRAKAFIDNWIRRQLLLHQAESSIDKAELDFSKDIEDYRNSLIIYKYESKLIKQKLDTVITEEEIAKYVINNAPVEMDKEMIRFIILNMRKKELLEKMNNSLYKQAVRDRVFEIY